jgi:hypothetical protein
MSTRKRSRSINRSQQTIKSYALTEKCTGHVLILPRLLYLGAKIIP